jgi:hypothetical protein
VTAPESESFRLFLEWFAREPNFASGVLFTDIESFTRYGFANSRDMRLWTEENPHAKFVRANQVRYSLNMWRGMVHG